MDRVMMKEVEEKRKAFKRERDYSLRCKCSGCGRAIKTELHYEDDDWLVKLMPCEVCMTAENIKGYNEGYDRGYGAGFDDGQAS